MTYTFVAIGEAIGNSLPIPTLAFTSAGVLVELPKVTTDRTGTDSGTTNS